jgi:hypothetical protein
LPPGVAALQVSDESASSGVSVPVQENPIDEPWQPWTLESGPQLGDVKWTQQNNVDPPLGVPSLHTSVESVCSGFAPLSQEYPKELSEHPATEESWPQPATAGAVTVAEQPKRPRRQDAVANAYLFTPPYAAIPMPRRVAPPAPARR